MLPIDLHKYLQNLQITIIHKIQHYLQFFQNYKSQHVHFLLGRNFQQQQIHKLHHLNQSSICNYHQLKLQIEYHYLLQRYFVLHWLYLAALPHKTRINTRFSHQTKSDSDKLFRVKLGSERHRRGASRGYNRIILIFALAFFLLTITPFDVIINIENERRTSRC